MAKPNTTGLANPDDYSLGRGRLYAGTLDANDRVGPYRDLGNCSEFNVSEQTDTLEHKSSRSGLATVDKSVTLSTKLSISFKLDEFNAENLALWFSGEETTYTNPAVAGFAEINKWIVAVELGRWYQLTNATTGGRPTGSKVMGVDHTKITLEKDAAMDVTLDYGIDYTVDEVQGLIFFYSTAVKVAAGDDVNLTMAADAGAPTPIRLIRALTQTDAQVGLMFVEENPANNDEQSHHCFHKVTLKPDGDLALIGEDWATMGFTGVLESNVTADVDSPFYTHYTHSEM